MNRISRASIDDIEKLAKDILLLSVCLGAIAGISVYLTATDRIQQPVRFQSETNSDAAMAAVVSELDASIEANLADHKLRFSDPAGWSTVMRRLSLALTGTLPSVEELRALEKIEPHRRVDWHVSHLLEDQRSSDYLSERFARVIVGVDEGPFLVYRRRRFVAWLSDQLHAKRPYDDLVRQMLTDDGLWTDSPAVNYYTHNIIPDVEQDSKPDPIRLAGRTSRAFLGMRIDCLQCHDDFMGTMNLGSADEPLAGLQLDFHSLASFFSQVENSLVGISDNLDSDSYRYQLLESKQSEPIPARVPFNRKMDDDSESNLRLRLASWVTHRDNRPFARAVVNRVWAILFGVGLVQPVDNIPLDGPFPAALELLVDDFIEHEFDIQRLIRTITNTAAFQRDSTADFEITDAHVAGWAVFPMTRLRPEQVAGSIIQSTSLKTIDATAHVFSRLVNVGERNEFVNRFGDLGEEEFNDRNETVTQRLLMLNGNVIKDRLDNDLNSVARINVLSPSLEKAVETVFLSTLSRVPADEVRNHFVAQLEPLSGDDRRNRFRDLYWTLINSTEFSWNH